MKKHQLDNCISVAWLAFTKVKDKILNFDIEPVRPLLNQKIALAEEYVAAGYYHKAISIYHDLFRNHPKNTSVLNLLTDLHMLQKNYKAAYKLARYGVQIAPHSFDFNYMLGVVCLQLQKRAAAKKYLARASKICPDSSSVGHLLAALQGENVARPVDGYVEGLFDSYASSFEYDLTVILQYKSHIMLATALEEHVTTPVQKVLDLGCGTGLLGVELKQRFEIANLSGVDISSKMLEQCKQKNLYDNLHEADLLTFMQDAKPGFELIACSDVLVYMGDLEEVFAQAQRILSINGFFAFTVEKCLFGSYKLMPNGRYQHSLRYIQSLYKRHLFSKMYSQTIDLRKEYGNMVSGYLVLLQK